MVLLLASCVISPQLFPHFPRLKWKVINVSAFITIPLLSHISSASLVNHKLLQLNHCEASTLVTNNLAPIISNPDLTITT